MAWTDQLSAGFEALKDEINNQIDEIKKKGDEGEVTIQELVKSITAEMNKKQNEFSKFISDKELDLQGFMKNLVDKEFQNIRGELQNRHVEAVNLRADINNVKTQRTSEKQVEETFRTNINQQIAGINKRIDEEISKRTLLENKFRDWFRAGMNLFGVK